MKKNKRRISEGSRLQKCLCGVFTIALCFLLLSLICSLILYNTENPTASVAIISMLSLIIAGGIGTFINMKLLYDGKFNSPLFSVLITTVIYLSISAITSGGFSIASLINSALIVFASFMAMFLGKKRGRKPVHRKR